MVVKTKKKSGLLVGAFALLTIVPVTFNFYLKIFPLFWKEIYPITYYFVGAYLREYKPKINKKVAILLLAILTLIFGTFNYFYFYRSYFEFSAFVGQAGGQAFVISILIFCILTNIDLTKLSKDTASLIIKISELSLGMYLLSYIFDDIFYTHYSFRLNAPTMIEQFKYYFVIVPVVFVCSAYASQIVEWIRKGVSLMYEKCVKKYKSYKNHKM